jgi:hypothetical protein
LNNPAGAVVESQAEGKGEETKSAKGKVNPEDPTPCSLLGEGAADYWPCNRADGPCQALEAEPLAPLSQRDEIGDQDLSQRNDTASPSALNAAANDKGGEILRQRSDNRSNSEKEQSEEDEGFAAKSMGEGREGGLKDGGTE